MKRNILCIDLKSFYASCECVSRGYNPYTTPLVVADPSRGGGSVVLAVTPFLKQQGVSSRCRVFELPKDQPIIMARPRMKHYLEVSAKIVGIYLDYVAEEDMHIYSIDEVFLDVTDYLHCHKKSDYEIAERILHDVYEQTGIPATCGIGPNMLIAKLALDIESKHVKSQIAVWTYEDIPSKLWPVTPLSKMWGISRNMEANLNSMGINTVGDLAQFDVELLKKRFGIMGEELHDHANGIDETRINEKHVIMHSKSYGMGQQLFKDYFGSNIHLIIREMVDEVCTRLRLNNKKGIVVHLGIGYSRRVGGGFGRQMKLATPTHFTDEIYDACMCLFHKNYRDKPIRSVHISISGLVDVEHHYQLNLFENVEVKERTNQLERSMDLIKHRFGKNSLLRASSYLEDANQRMRNTLIGGHNSE